MVLCKSQRIGMGALLDITPLWTIAFFFKQPARRQTHGYEKNKQPGQIFRMGYFFHFNVLISFNTSSRTKSITGFNESASGAALKYNDPRIKWLTLSET